MNCVTLAMICLIYSYELCDSCYELFDSSYWIVDSIYELCDSGIHHYYSM